MTLENFLSYLLLFLRGVSGRAIQMLVPMHRARWMAKVILRDKDVLVLWPTQIDNARTKWSSLYSLSVLIHLRALMPAALHVVVPLNDFIPIFQFQLFIATQKQLQLYSIITYQRN